MPQGSKELRDIFLREKDGLTDEGILRCEQGIKLLFPEAQDCEQN